MKPEITRQFIQDQYRFQGNEAIEFECRLNNNGTLSQVVSQTMSADEANKVKTQLHNILPQIATIEVFESKQVSGQFRAVIMNPQEVFLFYINRVIVLLNQFHPFPKEKNGHNANQINFWKLSLQSQNIILIADISFGYISLVSNAGDELKRKTTHEYISTLEKENPGLVISRETHKMGDIFVIDTLTFEYFQSLLARIEIPSLRQLGINFFKNNPQFFTEESRAKLPTEIADDMTHIPVARPTN